MHDARLPHRSGRRRNQEGWFHAARRRTVLLSRQEQRRGWQEVAREGSSSRMRGVGRGRPVQRATPVPEGRRLPSRGRRRGRIQRHQGDARTCHRAQARLRVLSGRVQHQVPHAGEGQDQCQIDVGRSRSRCYHRESGFGRHARGGRRPWRGGRRSRLGREERGMELREGGRRQRRRSHSNERLHHRAQGGQDCGGVRTATGKSTPDARI
mmetsp:Transcript_26975/g.75869  ORF Transcript_26975/g.75869 Transcript_26975/m.75869 type:complete len:210 (-) Transcript_26975:211-840(-)